MSILDLKVPVIGESVTEVTLSKWLKSDGDIVMIDEPLCEFESDKATLEFPAEATGKLTIVAAEGSDLKIGSLVARIDTSVSPSAAAPAPSPAPAKEPAAAAPVAATNTSQNYATGTPSPSAGKILAEKGVDPKSVQGTGVDGRITKADALNASSSPTPVPTEAATEQKPIPASPIISAFSRVERREKLSRMRRTIAKRLVSAKNNTAMLTTFNEVDMSEIMKLRSKVQDKFVAKHGIKLGFMSIFAKACAQVLLEMPEVNAMLDGEDIIFHEYADISIAVSTPTGLVVPPIHNVESLGFADVENKIKKLADKARDGKLTLEEMSGGTFTITNGGIFGSMMSTPIINEPQSAILGMHAIIERPVAIQGQVVIRPMMYVALSYDHRVIDGSSSVTFLVKVKQLLEDPTFLLLGL